MKLFIDTNIWVSAFVARGICTDLVQLAVRLHGEASFEALIDAQVRLETERIIRDKFCASASVLADVRLLLESVNTVAPGIWVAPHDFPDPDDAAIVSAALAAGTDAFVTGDKALIALGAIEGMPILDPRTAYLKLRGLA